MALVLSCNGFKLDSEKNCLNQESPCFKWDKTDPVFSSATPTPATQRATLPTITLVFSEDLRNGEDKSAYVLSGAGAQGLSIAAVKKISSLTYEVSLNGSIVASAPINLDFSALKDYSNNFISGQTSISYQGNVAVGITGSANHNGVGLTDPVVPAATGYPDVTVTFQHSYSTDPQNTWQISVTSGVVYCGAGVLVESSADGVYLQSGVNQVSSAIPVSVFGGATAVATPLAYRIVVCVKNKNNATVQSVWSWLIIRDDTRPGPSSGAPASDSYGTTQSLTISCGDNAEVIAVNSLSGTSDPGPPGDPIINGSTGVVTTGSQYTGAIPVTNSLGNPTYVNYKWRCMDIAGHQETNVQSRNFVIDTTIPAVNVTLTGSYHAYVSNLAGAYTNTSLSFTSDQVNQPYRIASGATLCSPSGGGASLIGIGPFTTNATANGSNGPHAIPATAFTIGVATDVRICVQHPILTTQWGTAYLQVTRDETVPVFTTGVTGLMNPGDGTVTLLWNPATDASGIEAYEICQSTAAGACATTFTAMYQANGAASSYQVTGLNTSTTYYFVVRARDLAGNRDANIVEKKSRLNLSVTVAGYSSAVPDFRITQGSSTLSFTANGTQTFTTVFNSGDAYSIAIINQPGGQNCAFVQNQYGYLSVDTTLNVTCAAGFIVSGTYSTSPAARFGYNLYRGNTTTIATTATTGLGTFVPSGIAFTSGGTMVLGEAATHRIYRLNPLTGAVTILAGSGVAGGTDGNGAAAQFHNPSYIASDGTNLYVSQVGATINPANNGDAIRRIDSAGNVTTLVSGAEAIDPEGLAFSGNMLYWANRSSHQIKAFNLATGLISVVAGSGAASSVDGTGIAATFNQPMAIAALNGKLYVTEFLGQKIRAVDISTQVVTTLAGSTAGITDGDASVAQFNGPAGIVSDGIDLYVADYTSRRIRRIRLDRTGGTNHQVMTISGSGASANANGVGVSASFIAPVAIATDGRNFYISDEAGAQVRKVMNLGQVGFWPLNNTARDFASDVTNAFNATPQNGPAQITGRFNEATGAYNLNGTNQYLSASPSNLPSGTAPETMCAWIKPNALPAPAAQPMVIMGHGGAMTNGMRSVGIHNNAGTQMLSFRGRGSDVEFPYVLSTTTWSHVCATFQHVAAGTQWASIFVNGKIIGRADTPVDWNTDVNSFTMGGPNLSGDIYFNGAIADVRVYNRVLGAGEINELAQDAIPANVGTSYNLGATGLLVHYEFTNGSAGAANLNPSGPVGGILNNSASSPIGKDGDVNGSAYFIGSTNLNGSATGLPIGNAPRTICAWFAPDALPVTGPGYGYIVSYGTAGSGSSPYTGFAIGLNNNSGTYSVANAFSFDSNLTALKPPINAWQHQCATYDGTSSRNYWNGNFIGGAYATSLDTQAAANFYLGAWLDGSSQFFRGKIDDVRIYNNALSQSQIRQLASQIPEGLLTRYDMVDSPAGTINDISGFGNSASASVGVSQSADRWLIPNQAYRFTNPASHRVASSAVATDALDKVSLSAWVRMGGSTGVNQMILINGNSGASGYMLHLDTSENIQVLCGGVASASPSPSYRIPQYVWTHIAAVRNGSWTIYINGAPLSMGSDCTPAAPSSFSGAVYVGANQAGLEGFRGDIQDARIYGKPLSQAEVKALAGYHPMQISSWSSTITSSSMKLHYNPDALSSMNDGDLISQWNDLSGSSMHLSQAASVDQPQFSATGMSGRYGVNFNTNRHFTRGCNVNLNSTATTFIGVMNQTNTSGGFRGIFHHGDKLLYFNGGTNQNLSYFQTGVDQVRVISQNSYITLVNPSADMIFSTAHDGSIGAIYKNGANVTTSSAAVSPAFSCSTGLTFGKPGWVGDNFNGIIGDFFYFNQGLLPPDRTVVECYLSSKYGIPMPGIMCP